MERYRTSLFTFLDYSGVPWNNNSAEHAVKAFVMMRREIGGNATNKRIGEYLVLMSLFETCRRRGIAFLDFLRSGETSIDAFAESRRKRRAVGARPPSETAADDNGVADPSGTALNAPQP